MNIIILEDSSKAGFGGGQQITIDVIKCLKESNSIYVFDTNESSYFTKKLFNLKIIPKLLKSYNKFSNFPFTFKIIFLNINYTIKNVSLLRNFIFSIIKDKNCIIYATTKKSLLLAYIIHIIYNIKYIYHAHMIENLYIKNLVLFLSNNAFKIICVSEKVAEQFNNYNQIVIIPNSIEQNNLKPKVISNKEKFIVASISSLNHIKGLNDFISSYDFLNNKNIIYHIYGDGPLKNNISKSTNKNIIYKGHANNVQDVLINNVDLLIVPSIIPESFCMILIEAFSCGVPAITTNLGMQKVHIEKSQAGDLFAINSPQSIADKINQIFANYDLYNFYSKNAINYSLQFDKKKFNKQIQEVFNN